MNRILEISHWNKNRQGTQVIHRMRLRIHREGIARDEARGNDQRVGAPERRRQNVHGVLGHVLRNGGGNRGFFRGLAMGEPNFNREKRGFSWLSIWINGSAYGSWDIIWKLDSWSNKTKK